MTMPRTFLFVMSLFFFSTSWAQSVPVDSVRSLRPVVVTANKIEQNQEETGKVLTVISSEMLRQNANQSLTEILNRQVGLVIGGSNSTSGSVQTVYMRGASAANTLILLDGIPLYDASGISSEFDLNTFLPSQIERVEILKGAQSTLYGSDAVAGVINIISKKPGSARSFSDAEFSGATYDTYRASLRAGGNSKKNTIYYYANYSMLRSRGLSSAYDSTGAADYDRDGHRQDALTFGLGFRPHAGFSLHLFGKYNTNRADIDAGAFTDDRDYTYSIKNSMLGFRSEWHVSPATSFSLNYQFNNYRREYVNGSGHIGGFSYDPYAYYMIYSRDAYDGLTHFAELNAVTKWGARFKTLAGLEYRGQATAQDYFYLSNYGPWRPLPLGKDTANARQFSGYALLLYANKGFSAGVGGRFNHHSIYGNNQTFSVNPAYTINDKWKLFVNIASAYRIPSLYQLYSEYGNKQLKPEESVSYEVGAQYDNDIFFTRVTAFRRKIRDVFAFYTDPVTYQGFYINEDRQDDKGIESELSVRLHERLRLSINHTMLTGALFTKDPLGKDTSFFNLYRRPKNVLNARVEYQDKKWFASVSLRSVSSSLEPFYGALPKRLSGYYTIDMQATYQWSPCVSLFADLRNITDCLYFDQWGYATMGRNLRAGVRVAF